MRKGFGFLEIIIVVAIIAVIGGGAFYFGKINGQQQSPVTLKNDEQQAQQVTQQLASATAPESNEIDALTNPTGTTTGTPTATAGATAATGAKTTPIVKSTATASTTIISTATTGTTTTGAADPLAGLGSNIYADGILPLGDYKYTTTGPKKGSVYLCNVASGGQGAQGTPPWIGSSTWNSNEKIAVEGENSWPNASITITVVNGTRTIVTNDLPTVGTTGNFPIESTDPAYQYDSNPNSTEAQDFTFALPAAPTAATAPQCIYGEVGVMTNGVLLLDGFDAEYRDAAAHELQDSCDGHPHEDGVYHYHSLSSCIPDATETNIIGWAFDGYPITGPEISADRYLTTADLDECHGITSPIMENGQMVNTYHYVMTQDFPYSVSCFHGKSYEPKPGPESSASSSVSSGQSSQNNSSNPTPPQAAITACAGSSSGASCSFSGAQGTVNGTCQTPPQQSSLACVPAKQ